MTTLKDIAEKANVSVNTVSRVLNGKSKDIWPRAKQQADEIRAIAKELNYIPNSAARAMRAKKFHRVGFVISGKYTAAVDFEMIMGVNDILNEQGYAVSVICVDELQEGFNILGRDSLDGIIVRHVLAPFREEIKKLSVNCVWLSTNEDHKSYCIRRDEFHAGQLATEKAIELGYQKVLYIQQEYQGSHAEPHYCFIDRPAGVKNVVEKVSGIDFEEITVPKERVSEALKDVYQNKINKNTAIIAADILAAEELTFHALGVGLCAGKDFTLISCDERQNTYKIWPDLSRVSNTRMQMGRQAAKMILSIIREENTSPESITIKDEWRVGKTALPVKEGQGK